MGLERSGVGMAEIQFSLPFSLHRFPLLLWGAIQTLTQNWAIFLTEYFVEYEQ